MRCHILFFLRLRDSGSLPAALFRPPNRRIQIICPKARADTIPVTSGSGLHAISCGRMKALVLDQVDIEASENALSALEGFAFKTFHIELEHDDVEILTSIREMLGEYAIERRERN